MQNNKTPTVISYQLSVMSSAPPRRRSGFTLIELLVVLTLTALMASFAVVYSRKGGAQISLYVEAQKMAELVFRAKSLALTAYRNPSLGNNICGFGFAIDYTTSPREYYLFSYNKSGGGCSGIANIDTSRVSPLPNESYAINPDLTLQSSGGNVLYYVLFIPPNPTTIVSNKADGSYSVIGHGDIMLQAPNGTGMTIIVSSGGQISF